MRWWWSNTLRGTQQDKRALVDVLDRCQIRPQGYLNKILSTDGEPAWRYLAYAVRRYPTHSGVLRKLKKLATVQAGGSTPQETDNNIDRDYATRLLEFKALYALDRLGHRLVEADVKVGGVGGNQHRDCDWLVERGERLFRVEVKRWCGDINSKRPLKGDIGKHFKKSEPDYGKAVNWLRDRCEEVTEKQADMLVCHISGAWDIDEVYINQAGTYVIPFSSRSLRAYCDGFLPGALRWSKSGPIWSRNVPTSSSVKQIIFVYPKGWWLLRVGLKQPLIAKRAGSSMVRAAGS